MIASAGATVARWPHHRYLRGLDAVVADKNSTPDQVGAVAQRPERQEPGRERLGALELVVLPNLPVPDPGTKGMSHHDGSAHRPPPHAHHCDCAGHQAYGNWAKNQKRMEENPVAGPHARTPLARAGAALSMQTDGALATRP